MYSILRHPFPPVSVSSVNLLAWQWCRLSDEIIWIWCWENISAYCSFLDCKHFVDNRDSAQSCRWFIGIMYICLVFKLMWSRCGTNGVTWHNCISFHGFWIIPSNDLPSLWEYLKWFVRKKLRALTRMLNRNFSHLFIIPNIEFISFSFGMLMMRVKHSASLRSLISVDLHCG